MSKNCKVAKCNKCGTINDISVECRYCRQYCALQAIRAMSKKSYADQCLERAEKATVGPWKSTWREDENRNKKQIESTSSIVFGKSFILPHDAEFISHARTDVPELARRLKKACEALAKIAYWKSDANVCCFPEDCYGLIDELEAPLENK